MATDRWKVSGARADDGKDASVVVHAPNKEEAARVARAAGVLVADIVPDAPRPDVPVDRGMLRGEPEPLFRFRYSEAFTFGFFAGLGLTCVYVVIRLAEWILAMAAVAAK